MKTGKRRHSAQFKVKVVLEALRGEEAIGVLAARHEIHPTQINKWKRQLLKAMPTVFGQATERKTQDESTLRDSLYRQIGELQVENRWLKKNWGFDPGPAPRRPGAGASGPFASETAPPAGGVAVGNVLSAG
jgi:transposase-like protein